MKYCPKCEMTKSKADFHRSASQQSGLQTFCKLCRTISQREYRRTPHGRKKQKEYKCRAKEGRTVPRKNYAKTYLLQWQDFFNAEYGINLQCQVCDKALSFGTGRKMDTVHFDHRMGDEVIQIEPAHFYRNRPCTEKNRVIWLSCNFGILCSRCNAALPTEDRTKWLEDVAKYIEETQLCK